MKRKSRKLCSLIVASSMVLSMSVSPVFGAQFEDTADHWASKQINTWSDYGVINGYEGLFRPNDPITRGEMAVIMNNIMQYRVKGTNTFKDLDYGFYRDAILKASNAGVMNGSDGLVRPKDNITREESAILICNTMGIDPSDSSSQTFDDSGDISSWAKPYVNALLNKGYISGKGDNNFDPQGYITRGETVTILDNIVKGFYNSAGTYTQNADGTVVVNSADAVLKNMNITGDLIISEGVGDGDIILEDVTLGGALIVRGGGENSIHFRGSKTQIPNVKMEKKDGNVRLATDGQAKVGNVLVKDESKEVKLEGTFTSVNVSSTNIVRVQKANITKLSVDIEKANIRVDSNSIVETLEVPSNAKSSELYIEGTVKNLQALAKSVNLQTTTSSIIETLTVSESASNADINLGGRVTSVNVSASDTKFVVNKSAIITNITVSVSVVGINFEISGTISTLTTHGTDIKINVVSTGTISTITASESSSNITISGSGKVEQVYANGNDITITTGGTQVTTGSNATGVVVNNVKVESNKTIVTTGQNGGITNPTDNNSGSSGSTDVAAGAKRIVNTIEQNNGYFTSVKRGDNVLDTVKQAVGTVDITGYTITVHSTENQNIVDLQGGTAQTGITDVVFKVVSNTNSKNTATTDKIKVTVSEPPVPTPVTTKVYSDDLNSFVLEFSVPIANLEASNIEIAGVTIQSVNKVNDSNYKYIVTTSNLLPETKYTVTIKNLGNYNFISPIEFTTGAISDDDPAAGAKRLMTKVYNNVASLGKVNINDNIFTIAKGEIDFTGYNITMVSSDSAVIDETGKALAAGSAIVTFTITSITNPEDITSQSITFEVEDNGNVPEEKTDVTIKSISGINLNSFKLEFEASVTGLSENDITLDKGATVTKVETTDNGLSYTVNTSQLTEGEQYTVTLNGEKYNVSGSTTFTAIKENIEPGTVKITLNNNSPTVGEYVYSNVTSSVYEDVYLKTSNDDSYTIDDNGRITIKFVIESKYKVEGAGKGLDISGLTFNLYKGGVNVSTGTVSGSELTITPFGIDSTSTDDEVFTLKIEGSPDNKPLDSNGVKDLTITVKKSSGNQTPIQ